MSVVEVIKEIRASAVQVCLRTVDGDDHKVLGSGFFVSDTGHVLTASHVVPNVLDHELDQLCVGVPGPDIPGLAGAPGGPPMFLHLNARLSGREESTDLALLQIESGPVGPTLRVQAEGVDGEFELTLKPARFATDPVDAGSRIAVSGFPLKQPSLVTTVGHVATNFATVGNGSPRLLGDLTMNEGNSGGPVYLAESGLVVGVATAGLLARAVVPDVFRGTVSILAGLAEVVPTALVLQFLAGFGLSVDSLSETRFLGTPES